MGSLSWLFLGLTLTLFTYHTTFADIPSFVVPCDKSDVACQTRVGQAAVPTLTKGDSSLNIATLDPTNVGTVDLSTGGLKFECFNTVFKGLSSMIFNKFHIDLSEGKMKIKLEIPRMTVESKYKAGGQIIVLPIRGEGDAEVKIKKAVFDITYALSTKERDGKKYMSLKDVNYKYDLVDNVHFQFENLFYGNMLLSDVTHRFMNSQWKPVSAELSPPIGKLIVKGLTENLKKLFNAIPMDNWIKP